MGKLEDRFEPLLPDGGASPLAPEESSPPVPVLTARLHGFDLDDRPQLSAVTALPGEIVTARSTVAISRAQIGAEVVVVLEAADPHRPIVIGVLQPAMPAQLPAPGPVAVTADGDRQVISAEREIVLRCGEASITLTRAGKVVIRGSYILSRSRGYNKIKGAAIELN